MTIRLTSILALLMLTACGLAEGDRDDNNKHEYITFSNAEFGAYCLEHWDLNDDGRISVYEAQRVVEIDCANRQIEGSIDLDIRYFVNLRKFNCSGNQLAMLDLTKCTDLRTLDCSNNLLASLSIRNLRSLTDLSCQKNRLAQLELGTNTSLRRLDCRDNLLVTLDVRTCSTALQADVTSNPQLTRVYALQSQGINSDGTTEVIAN